MAQKRLFQALLIWTLMRTVNAYEVTLPQELGSFIPSCAQGCLRAFTEDNFPSAACGTQPSFQCLCSHESSSGFTIAEGAVECLVAAEKVNICSSGEVSGSSIAAAYNMCSGQSNALPNTHPTLSATLVLTGSGSVVSIVSPTPTTSTSITTSIGGFSTIPSSSALSSSARVSTITSIFTASTVTSTATSTSFSISNPTVATSSTSAAAAPTAPPNAVSLGTPQIVGISVGVVGAIALAMVAIFLARRVRRRRYPNVDDDSGFWTVDEKGSYSGFTGGAKARLTKVFHISPPILKPQLWEQPQTPPQHPESQPDRSTIGLAISRPRSEIAPKPEMRTPETPERRTSRLLPPKPVVLKPHLTVAIPNAIHPALRPGSQQPPQTDRTSTMTNMTAFADLDTEAAEGAQIWRPPPSDPQSATTYYVADKWGNWVLSNGNRQSVLEQVTETAELDTYTPLTKSPIERQEEAARRARSLSVVSPEVSKPDPAFLSAKESRNIKSGASSLYSQASAVRPGPRPLAALARSSSSGGRRKPGRTDSKRSHDSATTINTSSSVGSGGPFDDDPSPPEPEPGRPLSTLSPVVESPYTPEKGRSRVQYPKIHGRLDGATIRYVPPPRRPDFTASPPGQPSPTLGAAMSMQGSPSAYPLPLNPRRPRSIQRDQAYHQPPMQPGATMRGSAPYQSVGSGFSPERMPSLPQFPVTPPNPPPRSQLRLSRQSLATSGPVPRMVPRIDTQNIPTDSRPRVNSSTSPVSVMTARSKSSVASSLLAKRVGSERAAALSLDQQRPDGNWTAGNREWQRQAGAAPFLLSPAMIRVRGEVDGGMTTMSPTGLPATPTWQPRLTPTRRGEDLFLNVQ